MAQRPHAMPDKAGTNRTCTSFEVPADQPTRHTETLRPFRYSFAADSRSSSICQKPQQVTERHSRQVNIVLDPHPGHPDHFVPTTAKLVDKVDVVICTTLVHWCWTQVLIEFETV